MMSDILVIVFCMYVMSIACCGLTIALDIFDDTTFGNFEHLCLCFCPIVNTIFAMYIIFWLLISIPKCMYNVICTAIKGLSIIKKRPKLWK